MYLIRRIATLAAVAAVAIMAITLGGSAQAAVVTVSSSPVHTVDSVTFDGTVRSTSYLGNIIFVAGDFANAIVHGKKVSRTRLATIDATTGGLYPWNPKPNGEVWSLAVDPATNIVYVGGAFKKVNGVARQGLAALDFNGTVLPFNHAVTGTPYALAVDSGRLFLGGQVSAIDGAPVTNLAAFSLATGARDTGWTATANGIVRTLVPGGGRLYVGGQFHNVDKVAGTARLAALSPTTGARDAGFAPVISSVIYGIAVGPSGVYAAMGGSHGGRAIALTTSGALKWQDYTDGDVQAVAVLGSAVYYGGHFDNVCSSPGVKSTGACIGGHTARVKLAAADASTGGLLGWNPKANGVHGVESMAAQPSMNRLVAGGEFTTIGGAWWPRFIQFG